MTTDKTEESARKSGDSGGPDRYGMAALGADIVDICHRNLLDRIGPGADLASRIWRQLLSTPGEFPGADVIAKRLALGGRTLRRRLNELGTSYRAILDEVRRELAVEYLKTTNLTIQEIAELLGYTEVANFSRAFVRWLNRTPYQFRMQLGVA